MIRPVKIHFLGLAIGLTSALSGWGQENSAQRLENAQEGLADASWPKKPDHRLSPLSGKRREVMEISPRFYGQDREFRAKSAEGWRNEARVGSRSEWEGASDHRWGDARWRDGRAAESDGARNPKFQAQQELASEKTVTFHEIEKKHGKDWSSRAAPVGRQNDGSLRMYEGRLTRVRQRLEQGSPQENGRDLGPDRQEKFQPSDVEKMLADPLGTIRGEGAREQSREAFPPVAADN